MTKKKQHSRRKSPSLTSGAKPNTLNGRMILGQYRVEILTINHDEREIRLLVQTPFSPADIKKDPQALAAVERQRDNACRYLTLEGFLNKPCGHLRDQEWCVRAGVVHIKPHDKA